MTGRQDESRRAKLHIQAIRRLWSREAHECVPEGHRLREEPVESWGVAILEAIEGIAQMAPVGGLWKTRARRRALLVIEEQFRARYPLTHDDVVAALHNAARQYTEYWPRGRAAGMPITPTYPQPDAVEDFGALEQPGSAEAQSIADRAVLEAYRNALARRGAAFGQPEEGPTLSTHATASRPKNTMSDDSAEGELWKTPESTWREGHGLVRPVYGNVATKRKFFAQLEARFGVPLAQFLRMEDLRPEWAYFFPANLARAIVALTMQFPRLTHTDVYRLLVAEKRLDEWERRRDSVRAWCNITEPLLKKATRRMYLAEGDVARALEACRAERAGEPVDGGASAAAPAAPTAAAVAATQAGPVGDDVQDAVMSNNDGVVGGAVREAAMSSNGNHVGEVRRNVVTAVYNSFGEALRGLTASQQDDNAGSDDGRERWARVVSPETAPMMVRNEMSLGAAAEDDGGGSNQEVVQEGSAALVGGERRVGYEELIGQLKELRRQRSSVEEQERELEDRLEALGQTREGIVAKEEDILRYLCEEE